VTPQVESPPQLATLADPALDELIPELDVAMIDVDGLNDVLPLAPPKDADSNRPLLIYDRRHPNSPAWSKLATIQHSNLVQFKFQYRTIPEDLELLRQFLRTAERSDRSEDPAIRARGILTLFEQHAAVQTDMSAVVKLIDLWVENPNLVMGAETPPTRSVQVLVNFHTYFDIGTWQTIRLLDCFVCSQTAWNLLLQVSRYEDPPARDPWMSDQRADLCACVHPLRSFHGKESTTAALLNLELQLCGPNPRDPSTSDLRHAPSKTDLTWEKVTKPTREDLFFHNNVWARPDIHWQYTRSTTKQREIHPFAPVASWLDAILQARSIQQKGEQGAILLRKPPTWPESCPFFCLAVFDANVDFFTERSLGQMLDQALLAKDIYVVTDGENKPRPFGDVDYRASQLWANILGGRAAAETPWPALQ
jgi:hypothetical protein